MAEIVIFALCWLFVASLMLWGVFTEHRRGNAPRVDRDWQPVRQNRVAHTDWIVLESSAGSTPEVEAQTRLIATALLASRGIDIESLPPDDVRTEVTTASDGAGTTRILVRAGAMHASRRHQ